MKVKKLYHELFINNTIEEIEDYDVIALADIRGNRIGTNVVGIEIDKEDKLILIHYNIDEYGKRY
jgi:hypothetical protein